MRIEWTPNARRNLQAIRDHIAIDSPTNADRMIDRIIKRADHLTLFPHSGWEVPEYRSKEVREVVETPYRIFYRVMGDRVDVLAVMHGARRLPRTI